MRCGRCPPVTATSRHAGGSSRRHSHAGFPSASAFRPAARANANAVSGNAASGSTRSATTAILLDTSITFTSIRSSIAMSSASKIGRFHHSIGWCGSAATRPNGRTVLAMSRTAALARGDGFRFAQPILRTTHYYAFLRLIVDVTRTARQPLCFSNELSHCDHNRGRTGKARGPSVHYGRKSQCLEKRIAVRRLAPIRDHRWQSVRRQEPKYCGNNKQQGC
jgi:hypothetical protein